ncbi:hypothetical protein DVH02_03925 [Streptomyces corynorhini]|uniref:Uncharacterized protein n=1 Tax=Streptomyces corynorhini TaxID=2282652 RepID=A0A370BCG5_9ACTN|nr:hypothetical protein DVH02_03925 [Streptomyces corynorhini]
MDMQQWRDGRKSADDATYALKEALAACGFPEHQYRHARPVLPHSGRPYVHLGLIPAAMVEKIAEALRREASSKP